MEPNAAYVRAIVATAKVGNDLWQWLCDKHPNVAIEYEKHVGGREVIA
jgi:hypothetical protein